LKELCFEKELRFFNIASSITVHSERALMFSGTPKNFHFFTQPSPKSQFSPFDSSRKNEEVEC